MCPKQNKDEGEMAVWLTIVLKTVIRISEMC